MNFSRKLRELRVERDMTQDDVGQAIGVDKRHVSTWENGRSNPSAESLISLSKLFGVSIDYLLLDNVPREGVEAINDIELYEYFRKTETLPKEMKQTVKDVIDAIVFKSKVKEIPEGDVKTVSEPPAKQISFRKTRRA